jgi:hypothetical protein
MKAVQFNNIPSSLTPEEAFDFGLVKSNSKKKALQFIRSWRLNPSRIRDWQALVAQIQALPADEARHFDAVAALDLYFRTFVTPSIDPVDCVGLDTVIFEVSGIGAGAFDIGEEVLCLGFGSAVAASKPLKITMSPETLQAICHENALRTAIVVASQTLQ